MTWELLTKAETPAQILFANRMMRWADRGMPGAMLTTYSLDYPWQWNKIFRTMRGMLCSE